MKRREFLTKAAAGATPAAAGEIVPPLQVFDAVQDGTIEAGHVLSTFFFGKNPAIAFDAGVPFGLNMRQQFAWMFNGGGLEMMREVFKPFNIVPLPVGNVGVQMGGWYRKEIKTVADLKGLKFRIGGFGGAILIKLGAVPQQIPPGEVYSSLEKGLIDGAEWIGPYDRDALECAAAEQCTLMISKYDAKNPEALKRLVAGGAQLRQFPKAVMDACYKATVETMDEFSAKSPDFKRIYESWKKFRDDQNLWFRVAEHTLDSYRYGVGAKPAAAAK